MIEKFLYVLNYLRTAAFWDFGLRQLSPNPLSRCEKTQIKKNKYTCVQKQTLIDWKRKDGPRQPLRGAIMTSSWDPERVTLLRCGALGGDH